MYSIILFWIFLKGSAVDSVHGWVTVSKRYVHQECCIKPAVTDVGEVGTHSSNVL